MGQKEKQQEMSMLVQAWASSGLTQKDFCKSEKINLNTFRYWVGKARRSKKDDMASESAFIPVLR